MKGDNRNTWTIQNVIIIFCRGQLKDLWRAESKLVLHDLHFSMGMSVCGKPSDYKPLNDLMWSNCTYFHFHHFGFFSDKNTKTSVTKRKLQHSSWLICKQIKMQVSSFLSPHSTNNTSNIFPSLKKTNIHCTVIPIPRSVWNQRVTFVQHKTIIRSNG